MTLVGRGEGEQSALILFWVKPYRLIGWLFFKFFLESEATLKDGTLVTVKRGRVLLAEGWCNGEMYVNSASQAVHPNPMFKDLV